MPHPPQPTSLLSATTESGSAEPESCTCTRVGTRNAESEMNGSRQNRWTDLEGFRRLGPGYVANHRRTLILQAWPSRENRVKDGPVQAALVGEALMTARHHRALRWYGGVGEERGEGGMAPHAETRTANATRAQTLD
jgi:hypothetical protein